MKHNALLIGTLFAWPALVAGQVPAAEQQAVIVMSGEGVVKAAPDVAWVVLAAETRSKQPKEAQANNAKAMATVQATLVAAGFPKDAVRTLSYDLQLESDWVNGKQVPRGYVARNSIEVRLDDITRVGEVIDISVTSGATSVHGVRFDLKQRAALEREALTRATADARARAEAAAAGAGVTLGRVLRVEEPSGRNYPMAAPPMAMMRQAAQDSAAPTPVVAGEIEIRAAIVLTMTLGKS